MTGNLVKKNDFIKENLNGQFVVDTKTVARIKSDIWFGYSNQGVSLS